MGTANIKLNSILIMEILLYVKNSVTNSEIDEFVALFSYIILLQNECLYQVDRVMSLVLLICHLTMHGSQKQ